MKDFFQSDKGPVALICCIGLTFFAGIGQFHLFDWDEINFAECAREMIVSGNYLLVQMDFEPFWEKPPLFFWLQAISMHTFGINEFAARFPNALIGLVTLLTLYFVGKKHFSRQHGFVWAMLYAGALLPHFYFKSGIIDPVFNYFIFMGLYSFLCYRAQHMKLKYAAMSGLFIGLAVLTKGPVGLLLFLVSTGVYFIIQKFKGLPKIAHIGVFLLVLVLVMFSWWGFDIANNGFAMVEDFIDYQIRLFSTPDAGHQQPWFYHFVVVFLGCFPLSVFALKAFFKNHDDPMQFGLWMKILLWTVLCVFTIVSTKIIHYSSMAYLPLSYLATRAVLNDKAAIPKWILGMYLGFGSLWGVALVIVPFILPNKELMSDLLAKDPFASASFLQDVPWSGFEFLGGVLLLASLFLGWNYYKKKQQIRAATVQAFGVALSFSFLAFFVLPKIEQYVQGPAIDFYKQAQGKDVYLDIVGYKSYGRAFYAKTQPGNGKPELGWLLNSDEIDKDVYIVTKSTDNRYENDERLQLEKQTGGYKLYVRKINP